MSKSLHLAQALKEIQFTTQLSLCLCRLADVFDINVKNNQTRYFRCVFASSQMFLTLMSRIAGSSFITVFFTGYRLF